MSISSRDGRYSHPSHYKRNRQLQPCSNFLTLCLGSNSAASRHSRNSNSHECRCRGCFRTGSHYLSSGR